jgi:hypothetical protein
MGGYEVLVKSEEANFSPRIRALDEARRGMRLSPDAFRALADRFPHLIPDLSQEKIEDKSKGDAIAKALICFQCMGTPRPKTMNLAFTDAYCTAAWFCAQCVARLGQRVGISLLELNTLGHALCALLIYCLWWDNPLDTKEPEQIIVQREEELQFVASLCFISCVDDNESERDRLKRLASRTLEVYILENFQQERWRPTLNNKPTSWTRILTKPGKWINHPPPLLGGRLGEALDQGFFVVISCGTEGKKWLAGLGSMRVRPKATPGSKEGKLLWTEGTVFKS